MAAQLYEQRICTDDLGYTNQSIFQRAQMESPFIINSLKAFGQSYPTNQPSEMCIFLYLVFILYVHLYTCTWNVKHCWKMQEQMEFPIENNEITENINKLTHICRIFKNFYVFELLKQFMDPCA